MESTFYRVRFFSRSGDVVHEFVIKTLKPLRVLDVCRSWLAGNNYMIDNHIIERLECDSIDDEEV